MLFELHSPGFRRGFGCGFGCGFKHELVTSCPFPGSDSFPRAICEPSSGRPSMESCLLGWLHPGPGEIPRGFLRDAQKSCRGGGGFGNSPLSEAVRIAEPCHTSKYIQAAHEEREHFSILGGLGPSIDVVRKMLFEREAGASWPQPGNSGSLSALWEGKQDVFHVHSPREPGFLHRKSNCPRRTPATGSSCFKGSPAPIALPSCFPKTPLLWGGLG